ncbi:MAG TPA: hypothetical protein VMF67_04960 [Rhizomicrobium sp.]|nr:hypothetical protein [Rhizomicrobium sp.]
MSFSPIGSSGNHPLPERNVQDRRLPAHLRAACDMNGPDYFFSPPHIHGADA